VLVLWYHEGLDSFEHQLQGGRELLERFGARVNALRSREELYALIQETREARSEIASRLQDGRDRLLELNSFRASAAAALVEEIRHQDNDLTLERFMVSVLDFFSIHLEEIADRTYKVGSAGILADSFPGLPAGGFTLTCDRQRALLREDVQFLTWDHPLVTGALDLLLGSEKGNCSLVEEANGSSDAKLEAAYVLECIAPIHLHVDRFLPPTPVLVVVEGNVAEEMLERARSLAVKQVTDLIANARKEMTEQLSTEITRLIELQKVNPTVSDEEIGLLKDQERALDEHLGRARLRLDAVRLWLAPRL
jgi:ATP-dependent helicase HepA